MEQTLTTLLFADIAFGLVAATTWFFSSRPRFFIRCFVPADEVRAVARRMLRDKNHVKGMRIIAILQFAMTGVLMIATLVVWLMMSKATG